MERIDPAAGVGAVSLTVADLGVARDFYQRVLGLSPVEAGDERVRLGAGERALVELVSAPGAPPRPPRTTGLFHLAILVPDRAALGCALRRVTDAGWGLTGASDHLVSEALYTRDPEGNGIEIYRDRPRAEWGRVGDEIQMDSLPLDLESILAEDDPPSPSESVPETRIGHVHLNVADIAASERFYGAGLGLDVTVRGYPGALFMAAGGYHHHLGLNTWNGEGIPAPPEGSLGLRRYEVLVAAPEDIDAAQRRIADAGFETAREDAALLARDPSGNLAAIRAR